MTDPHCWVCVTVNKCWFKNEDNKKPEHFDYSTYSYSSIGKSNRGIYHPFCHCREYAIIVPKINDIGLIIDPLKSNDFFKRKLGWFREMGYKDADKNEFINLLQEKSKDAYRKGN